MENKIVKKEGYKVELEIALTKEEFNGYITKAYNKDKNKYMIQGSEEERLLNILLKEFMVKAYFMIQQ
jgi:hypothetical protein